MTPISISTPIDPALSADMTNHPNRNWRGRMHEAAASFVEQQPWPEGGDFALMSLEQVQKLVTDSFIAGYIECRKSQKP